MNAKEVFENEWALYSKGAVSGKLVADGSKKATKGEFDGGVTPGEFRIFADMKRPFVALVVEDRGLSGWKVVPVSPFTVPASSREMLVGERVLQLWNACVASRSFVERSWRVDSVAEADLADVKARMATVVPGRISAGDGTVAKYEKAFLVSGGNFVPLVERMQSKRPVGIWRRYGLWSIAAMLMICFGATWMVYQEQLKANEALRIENICRVKQGMAEFLVREEADEEELCEMPEDS